jgi:hypothetical protein
MSQESKIVVNVGLGLLSLLTTSVLSLRVMELSITPDTVACSLHGPLVLLPLFVGSDLVSLIVAVCIVSLILWTLRSKTQLMLLVCVLCPLLGALVLSLIIGRALVV